MSTGEAVLEPIIMPANQSFIWRQDDYPWQRSVWNYHPEVELHLIRHSRGVCYVGDYIGDFAPGHLTLIGPNLPHDWVTPRLDEAHIEKRDTVLQFSLDTFETLFCLAPEFEDVRMLLARSARGIEFHGSTAATAATKLDSIGTKNDARTLLKVFDILVTLAESLEYKLLSTQGYAQAFQEVSAHQHHNLAIALAYLQKNFMNDVSLSQLASQLNMSDSAFSRFFKDKTGNSFSDHLISLRLWSAKKLLEETDQSMREVSANSGFQNLSNFNRRFLKEAGMTPSKFRAQAQRRN